MIRLLKNLPKKEILMAVICILFIPGQIYFDLTLPDYMSRLTTLINSPDNGNKVQEIFTTGLSMLGCTLASAALCIACGFLSAKVAAGFSRAVRSKLFDRIMGFGKQEMQKFSVPSLINRTTNDITQIQMFVSMGLQMLIKAPIMAIWAVFKILGNNFELSMVTAVFVVIIAGSSVLIMSRVLPRFRIVQKLTDRINKVSQENLTGINVVHAFNAEEYQAEKFEKPNDELMQTQMKNQKLFAIFQPMMGLGMNGLSLTIYWLGAALLAKSAQPMVLFGDIVVFSTYATYVVMSFMMMIMIFMMFPAAQVSAGRINEVLKTKPSIKEGSETKSDEVGTVEFKNVSFTYPDSNDVQLCNISFKANKGETVAFIGATGSGKTTLVSLAARFYDTTSGEVLIDGKNVKDYTFEALYNKIAYITQRATIFSGTIDENVRFGETSFDISDTDVDKALDIAQATEFVKKQGGKDYRIAQSGKNLSGGQKQRLSIARALARKPEIIVFDDSFSALDYRTDAALRNALSENFSDTTRLIVAQRISTIRNADKIIVLDDGKAVGMGTHNELMKNCNVYREIAMSQLSESELSEGGM